MKGIQINVNMGGRIEKFENALLLNIPFCGLYPEGITSPFFFFLSFVCRVGRLFVFGGHLEGEIFSSFELLVGVLL